MRLAQLMFSEILFFSIMKLWERIAKLKKTVKPQIAVTKLRVICQRHQFNQPLQKVAFELLRWFPFFIYAGRLTDLKSDSSAHPA